jgi:hypothetical protein
MVILFLDLRFYTTRRLWDKRKATVKQKDIDTAWEARKKRADALNQEIREIKKDMGIGGERFILELAEQWKNEKANEAAKNNFSAKYGTALKNRFEKFRIISLTKRPFGFRITLKNKETLVFKVLMTKNGSCLKTDLNK